MEEYKSTNTTPFILNVGARWWRVVKCHAPAASSSGKEPRYPLNRRLGAFQSRFGRFREKMFVSFRDSNPGLFRRSLLAEPTTLSRLPVLLQMPGVKGKENGCSPTINWKPSADESIEYS